MKISSSFILAFLVLAGIPVRAGDSSVPLQVIAFGACLDQNRPQKIWKTVKAAKPDLFLFLGDTIYPAGNPSSPAQLKEAYAKLRNNPSFSAFRKSVPHLATWDDHDYGKNDGGFNNPSKQHSMWEFKNFFRLFELKEVAERDGVYSAHLFGPPGRKVQVLLLDTRYFRSPIPKSKKETGGTILGIEQWAWLERQLEIPADIRIIASSIQVLPTEHKYEKWGNFPWERDRLFELIRSKSADGVLFISGDRHYAEVSVLSDQQAYPLYELTAGPLDAAVFKDGVKEENSLRRGVYVGGNNFGLITIDWHSQDPHITLEIRDMAGKARIQKSVSLSQLSN